MMEERKKSASQVVWFFLKPYKLHILVLLGFSLLTGGLEAASVASIYPILNSAFSPDANQGTFIISFFREIAEVIPIEDDFITYCLLFMLLVVLDFAVKILSIRFRIGLNVRLVEANQRKIFDKYLNADYQFFVDHKQGDLIYNVISAPSSISSIVNALTTLLSQIILSISVLLLLFSLSWKGSIVVLLLAVAYHLFTRYLGKKISYRTSQGEIIAHKEGNVILNEAISGIKQVKVFATAGNWIDKFNDTIKRRWNYYKKRASWEQVPAPTLNLIMYASIGLIAIFMKMITPVGFTAAIPLFGTFAFAVLRLSPLVSTIGNLTMGIIGALPNVETAYEAVNENIAKIKDGDKEFVSFKSDISFENVSFTYKGRKAIIRDINVTFEKGKTTAIVGRSGEGKTTLVNIILRLFDVEQGAVTVDGTNIKEYKLSSWLKNIGYVSQDTFMLNDTVEKNITFRSDTYTREDVINAAKCADAHDFITMLPEGYDTLVGDKGMRLSGGQAQRIALSRAIIRNPEILIFDEATNNLDNVSEKIVQKAIDDISRNHTVIIIAHRLSTVVNADKIIVLRNGMIAEQGTHEELVARGGAYSNLHQGKAS